MIFFAKQVKSPVYNCLESKVLELIEEYIDLQIKQPICFISILEKNITSGNSNHV